MRESFGFAKDCTQCRRVSALSQELCEYVEAFDGRGNYSLGLKEQLIFPEIEYDKVDKIRGMDICFVTTAKTDEEARELLRLLGAPYAKD